MGLKLTVELGEGQERGTWSTQYSPTDTATTETLFLIKKIQSFVALDNVENPGERQEENKKHL